jgi:hypothetical protein
MELRQLVDQHRSEVLRVQDALTALRRDHARCIERLALGGPPGAPPVAAAAGWARRTRRGRGAGVRVARH